MMRATLNFLAPRSVFLRAGAIFCAVLALVGCNSTSPQVQTRVVAVPSSRPYQYIKPHKEDVLTKGTLDQISRHNQVHWKVKEAEKAAEQK
ncbi:MAG TPA: hypothetical protein VKZ94_18205 [Advenella sp.]|nr:hypothetical protein [Advenella sp.]